LVLGSSALADVNTKDKTNNVNITMPKAIRIFFIILNPS
jgi:hypothetical protein